MSLLHVPALQLHLLLQPSQWWRGDESSFSCGRGLTTFQPVMRRNHDHHSMSWVAFPAWVLKLSFPSVSNPLWAPSLKCPVPITNGVQERLKHCFNLWVIFSFFKDIFSFCLVSQKASLSHSAKCKWKIKLLVWSSEGYCLLLGQRQEQANSGAAGTAGGKGQPGTLCRCSSSEPHLQNPSVCVMYVCQWRTSSPLQWKLGECTEVRTLQCSLLKYHIWEKKLKQQVFACNLLALGKLLLPLSHRILLSSMLKCWV